MMRVLSATLALLVAAVLAGCSAGVPRSVEEDAARILAEHDLHSAGGFTAGTVELTEGDTFSALRIEAAAEGGWDLARYQGERLKTAKVTLAERSQSADGGVVAVFVYRDDAVSGAYLEMAGYVPGIAGIDQRYAFLPAGAEPADLLPARVDKVTLAGPWTGESWASSSTITARADIDAFVAGLEESVAHPSDRPAEVPGGEWAFTLHYDDGAQLIGRVRGSSAKAWIEYDAEAFPDEGYTADSTVVSRIVHSLTRF